MGAMMQIHGKRLQDWLDMPKPWMLGFLIAQLLLARFLPLVQITGGKWLGWVLIIMGAGLLGLTAAHMRKANTTILPRELPQHLVTDGPFRFSRNPMYVADALILTGAALVMGALSALLLVPGFVALITRRFIYAEEATLFRAYGAAYSEWQRRVRRWL